MKKTLITLTLGFMIAVSGHSAVSAETTPQQERMKTCNADATAKALKGDERKAFMSDCLSNKPAAPISQQEKMKVCNADATKKALKGDERKAFMSQCLSAK